MTQAAENFEHQIQECYRVCSDFNYFAEHYVYIEDKTTGAAIPFDLWPEQRRIIPQFLSKPRIISIKAHQLGITWIFASIALWLAITRTLQHIAVISANEDLSKEFVESRVKFMLARLPGWLYPPLFQDTTQQLSFDHRDEKGHPVRSIIQSLPSTEKGTQSKTPTLLIIDESALNRYTKNIYAASKPGIDAGKGRIVIISNPVKTAPGWPFTRKLYVGSMKGENDFERVFLSWRARPDRPENFRELQIQQGMDEEDLPQRYPETEEEAISALTGSYFGRTLARHIDTMDGVTGALYQDKEGDLQFREDPRGLLEIWRWPYSLTADWDGDWFTQRYAIGSDISEGLGQSYSVAYVYDRLLQEFVARLRGNRVDAWTWAQMLFSLGQWYRNALRWHPDAGGLDYQDALLCVERTGAGQTTVRRLQELGANQYIQEVPGTTGVPTKKTLGWSETNQAKHDLSEDLRHWFRTTQGTVFCSILLDECSTWIQPEGTNRLEPEEGHYGDCVIAAGLAIQASHAMGGSPKRLKPPVQGWRRRLKEEAKEGSEWAL